MLGVYGRGTLSLWAPPPHGSRMKDRDAGEKHGAVHGASVHDASHGELRITPASHEDHTSFTISQVHLRDTLSDVIMSRVRTLGSAGMDVRVYHTSRVSLN